MRNHEGEKGNKIYYVLTRIIDFVPKYLENQFSLNLQMWSLYKPILLSKVKKMQIDIAFENN